MDFLHGYGGQLALGLGVTLGVAGASLVLGTLLGLLGAAAKLSPRPWLRWPATLIANLIRGVPDFLILLICYFMVPELLSRLLHREIAPGPFVTGVLALSVVFGAYASEAFRGAFLAVPKGQLEAAFALGLRPAQAFFRIRLPQAWRFALPSLNNQWQSLLKDTSLVSVIGLEELMRKAQIGAQVTRQPFVFYGTAALVFLALWAVSIPAFQALERRARRGLGEAR